MNARPFLPAGGGGPGGIDCRSITVIHGSVCHGETQIICLMLLLSSCGERLSKHLDAMLIDVTLMPRVEGAF